MYMYDNGGFFYGLECFFIMGKEVFRRSTFQNGANTEVSMTTIRKCYFYSMAGLSVNILKEISHS